MDTLPVIMYPKPGRGTRAVNTDDVGVSISSRSCEGILGILGFGDAWLANFLINFRHPLKITKWIYGP